jgi:hypothetical protein
MNQESKSPAPLARKSVVRLASGEKMDIYSIRQAKSGSVWVRVGCAFVNPDGSMNLYLDALPLDGRLHVRRLSPVVAVNDGDASAA